MRRAAVLLVSGALAAAGVLYAPAPLAIAAGLLMVFVVPGAALHGALFARRSAGWQETLFLVPALSLTVVVLGGLALDAADVKLTRGAWLALLAGATVLGAAVTWYRQRGAVVEEREKAPVEAGDWLWLGRKLAPGLLAVALLGGAAWFSLRSEQHQPREGFTVLAMVPAFAHEPDGPQRTVSIGLQSEEHKVTDYTIKVRGHNKFEATLTARLWPGTTWAKQLKVPSEGRVTAELFRAGDKQPYRNVFLSGHE
ncbi:DUF1616 domain-containing protein [Longispora albida]|uniref:DUF1616 domain-containing protein n=1 Tax=Longispora albida TaxID=203523 RepID=UPI00035D6A71|nr:DUF1616 domain-containing protein [Longispora albida]